MQNIIKDLQDLHNRLVANYNDNVPFEQLEEDRLVVSNALDLINRYEAEMQHYKERLHNRKSEVNRLNSKVKSLKYNLKTAKAEARKEFAERLIEKATYMPIWNGMFKSKMVGTRVIKDLLKEMGVE